MKKALFIPLLMAASLSLASCGNNSANNKQKLEITGLGISADDGFIGAFKAENPDIDVVTTYNDIDLLDNDDNIFRDKGIEQTFNELIDYWKRKQWINTKFNLKKIQVQGNNIILNNNIDDIVTFSFNNNDDYTKFVNSLLESDIKIISTLTWITFNKGFIAEDFGDLSYCFETNKLYIIIA